MPKKKKQTPEDSDTVTIPEGNPEVVRIKKTKTNSFSDLGRYYKGCVYDVPWTVYQELERLGEAELIEVIN